MNDEQKKQQIREKVAAEFAEDNVRPDEVAGWRLVRTGSADTWPANTVRRCHNLGGAPVDVYTSRPVDEPSEADAFNWHCCGCGEIGQPDTESGLWYWEEKEVRQAAHEHAERCRFVTRPNHPNWKR